MCACDCKVLIGHWSNPVLKQHVMPPQPSERGIGAGNHAPTLLGGTALSLEVGDCLLPNCYKNSIQGISECQKNINQGKYPM